MMSSVTHTPSLAGDAARILTAEAMLPGHPDKLADQVADGVLDLALAQDERAIVQVEVALDRETCFVDGRCSTAGAPLDRDIAEATIRAIYERAGFGVPFTEVGEAEDWQCPRGEDVDVRLHLQIDEVDPDEREERHCSDDQALHIGYAVATPETRFLPLEQHLALALRERLVDLCATRRELGAGPDGKILVTLDPLPGAAALPRYRVRDVIVSVQHLERSPLVSLDRAVRECILAEIAAQHGRMPDLLAAADRDLTVRVNQSGVFVAGGPMNDNGQTGRKLVCDFYGPRVPIGGGALSGKDPWRLDRAGAFRTRQIALAIVDTGFVRDALVTFVWAPRDREPSHVEIVADGRTLAAIDVSRWLRRFDPSLQATWEELGLAGVNYENCARMGHFGRDVPWENSEGAQSGRGRKVARGLDDPEHPALVASGTED
jgi:S-adenosylmethionine synthetase